MLVIITSAQPTGPIFCLRLLLIFLHGNGLQTSIARTNTRVIGEIHNGGVELVKIGLLHHRRLLLGDRVKDL